MTLSTETITRIAKEENCWFTAGKDFILESKKTGKKKLIYTCGPILPNYTIKDIRTWCKNLSQ